MIESSEVMRDIFNAFWERLGDLIESEIDSLATYLLYGEVK